MKVLALASRFGLCGQGIAAHNISHELARRGHKVHLRVFDSVHELKGQFGSAAYEVEFRPSVPFMPTTGLHVLRQVMDLLRIQKDRDFDLVLGLDAAEAGVMGAALGKGAGLNVAFVAWGNELEGLNAAEKSVLRNCDLAMPVSRWAKANLIEAYFDEERMKVLPPGVDTSLFRPPKARPKGLGIVTIASLTKGSGVDQLIGALQLLLDKGQDARLTVIGTGPESRALKRKAKLALVEGSVDFLGRVPHARVPDILRGHRVFALVPRKVPQVVMPDVSIAMMEAASCGLGIVGTDVGGIADTLRACGGTKVPAEAPAKLADIIERVAGKPSIVLATEGQYGMMRPWTEVAEELEVVLEELVYE